jgi:hypothetical protein
MTCKRGGFLSRRPRAPHKSRRLMLFIYYTPKEKCSAESQGSQTAKMATETPWRSPRLKKRVPRVNSRQAVEMTLPQVTLKCDEEGKGAPRPKRMTKAMREREAVRQINAYRQKILEKVNRECVDYREQMAREQEEKRNTTISFNRKKEVLEFCKKLNIPPRPRRSSSEPQMIDYEIKSVMRGSTEVYVGKMSSKRNSILGNYNINEETVVELHSEECSLQKPPEEIPPPPPQKKSPKNSPKASPKPPTDHKKDKSAK